MFKIFRKLIISRNFTNFIRFIMDNLVPTSIRDSKFFMLPFFKLAYKGSDVKNYMEFKSNLYSINNDKLEKIYENYNSIGTERETDLNSKCVSYIIKSIPENTKNLLDVACGRGYFINKLSNKQFEKHGVDLLDNVKLNNAKYTRSNLENLPFKDNEFDVVVSSHTIEHVIDIRKAVSELKRVAAKQIIVTVPCQRFFYYTLDLHLHFFPKKEILVNLMDIDNYTIKKIGGDWVYIGHL